GGTGQFHPVAMLQRQNDSPGIVAVKQRRAAGRPWPFHRKAIVAQDILPFLARNGAAAFAADQARDEGRVPPAGGAEAEVAGHQRVAADALRRVDRRDRPLQAHPRPLWSAAMTKAPLLTDRRALGRNRARALALPEPALFLHETAADEVKERLETVNRTFTDAA